MDEPYRISFKTTLDNIKRDLARYRITENRSMLATLILSPGAFACIYYRFGHWIWYSESKHAHWLSILRPLYIVGKRLVEIYTGISVSPQARIGPGLYLNHFGSVFIGASTIGENCNFAHEVTVGISGRGDKRGRPEIGDRVFVGPGAKILGKLNIGNDVAIGANAVVTANLPDRAVALGIPAKVVSKNGSFEFILYDSMENDSRRLESLQGLQTN
jgi:serine O-acetyltransferase